MAGPILLQAAAREPRPWKNDGGRTTDIISEPPGSGLDDFGWRLSIAKVDADGPFSTFKEIRRHMIVLAGSLRLQGDGIDHTLSAGEAPFSFSGEIPVYGSLIDGPVRDLNLMVQVGRFEGRFDVVEAGRWRSGDSSTIVVAPDAVSITVDGVRFNLDAEDALLLPSLAEIATAAPLILAQVRDLI